MTLAARGQTAEARRLYGRAVAEQRLALVPNPQNREYRIRLMDGLYHVTGAYLDLKEHREAAKAALEFAGILRERWNDYREAAAFLVRCSALAANDSRLSREETRVYAEKYAAQAVEVLREASNIPGLKGIKEVKTAPALQALRSRDDFQALLRRVEKKIKQEQ
jgi:hypothetical protein